MQGRCVTAASFSSRTARCKGAAWLVCVWIYLYPIKTANLVGRFLITIAGWPLQPSPPSESALIPEINWSVLCRLHHVTKPTMAETSPATKTCGNLTTAHPQVSSLQQRSIARRRVQRCQVSSTPILSATAWASQSNVKWVCKCDCTLISSL